MGMQHHLPATARAPRFLGEGRIDFIEKPVPQPGPGQLLLKVQANALCGSERRQFYQGSHCTPGHEAAGVVIASGPGTTIPPGMQGVVYLMYFCGECRSCKLGFTNQCLNKQGDMGFNRDGGYGIYELVPERIFFPTGDTFDPVEATLLLDIMGTGGHAIHRAQLVHPDIESLAVMGAGPMGLAVLAMAKILLGTQLPVLIADVSTYRLALAAQLGGLPINLQDQSLKDGIHAAGLAGTDLAIDTSGKTAARRSALDSLNKRGVLVCVGHGEELPLNVSPDLIAAERAVLGSEYFPFADLAANAHLLAGHRAYLRPIITHTYPVSQIQQAFEQFFTGQTGKVVIAQ